jgi:hypothetical protein
MDQELNQKILSDLPLISQDPQFIDAYLKEAQSFHQYLTERNFCTENTVLLSCLQEESVIKTWIQYQSKESKKQLESLLKSDTAWTVDTRVKTLENVERFLLLLDQTKELAQRLFYPKHQGYFVSQIQWPMIESYLQEIRQKVEATAALRISDKKNQYNNRLKGHERLGMYHVALVIVKNHLLTLNHDLVSIISDLPQFYLNLAQFMEQETLFSALISSFQKRIDNLELLICEDVIQDVSETLWRYLRR